VLIAAPPRTLADLRQALHKDVKARIIAEVEMHYLPPQAAVPRCLARRRS
jgi:protein required for attachment to host cells